MKKVILSASITGLIAAAVQAQNANISWQQPLAISGASDVSTLGTLAGTWAPGDDYWNPDGLPVNGVTFAAYGSGVFSDPSASGWDSHYDFYQAPSTSDSNYNTILQAAIYDSSGNPSDNPSVTWAGMTPGDTYEVEIWVNDARGNGRSETITGGNNTTFSIVFGNNPGEYVIGTFVAGGTGSETISFNAAGSQNGSVPQVNLMEVRDISAVPEPAALGLLAGVGAMLISFRRKSWQG